MASDRVDTKQIPGAVEKQTQIANQDVLSVATL